MNLRSLGNSFRGIKRRVLATLAVAGFAVAGAAAATASGPAFNNLPNDYPTLQVAKHGEQWSTSTNAQVGDTVNLMVWAHNTVVDTTAHNTRAKVTLPTSFATTHTPSATVSADNASSVTGTANIGVGVQSKINYIPGSAKLYQNVNGTMQQVNWPAGVNPDDVVNGGVNLGEMQGCWQYAKAVLLQVKVEGGNPAINTNKQVQLNGGPAYSESAQASPGDTVNFKIFLENTGSATGNNAQIVDALDSRLTYVPNSSIVKKKVNNQDVYEPYADSNIQFNGNTLTWSFGNMLPQPNAALYLQFQAKLANADAFPVGTTTIQNCATSKFTGVSKDTNCVTITVTRNPEPTVSFTVKKEVLNITLGDNRWYDNNPGTAAPGDTVAYKLTVINTGNTPANSVTLKDILPSGVSFAGNVKLYNAANPNGMSLSGDSIVTSGHVFNQLVNGSANYQTIIFQAKVTEQCSGTQTYVNRAQVIYQGAVKAQDDATIVVSCSPGLNITKDVLNPTNGQYEDTVRGFREGDVVVFRIVVHNSGNTTVVNPVLRDVLPQYTQYQANSLTIDGEFMSQGVQDKFWAGGITLTNLTPGMTKTVTFRLKVVDCPPFGETRIENRAFVKADGIAEKSDTAVAIVTVNRPPLP